MKPEFSALLPVRDSDLEYEMLPYSLASAILCGPDELIIGLDMPSTRIMDKSIEIAKKMGYNGLQFLVIPPSTEWSFQLANIIWNGYKKAKHDIILSFDVDTVLYPKAIRKGLTVIHDRSDVAFVTFRKVMNIRSVLDLMRGVLYLFKKMGSRKPFTGLYFVNRQAYFQILTEEKMKFIKNGVDTILFTETLRQDKYTAIGLNDFGSFCLTRGNEEIPWRQFQVGVWMAAHSFEYMNLFLYAIQNLHPYVALGYFWASENSKSEPVKMAKKFTLDEFCFLGQETIRGLNV